MEPIHEEMERLGARLEEVLRDDVEHVSRNHLESVVGPAAPFDEAAARIMAEANIHVQDEVVEIDASRNETRPGPWRPLHEVPGRDPGQLRRSGRGRQPSRVPAEDRGAVALIWCAPESGWSPEVGWRQYFLKRKGAKTRRKHKVGLRKDNEISRRITGFLVRCTVSECRPRSYLFFSAHLR